MTTMMFNKNSKTIMMTRTILTLSLWSSLMKLICSRARVIMMHRLRQSLKKLLQKNNNLNKLKLNQSSFRKKRLFNHHLMCCMKFQSKKWTWTRWH